MRSLSLRATRPPRKAVAPRSRGSRRNPPLAADELAKIDAYWRAANYLSVGQIYLLDNPLLERPLTLEHIKPRLLGHWGTTPGLNFIYTHLNRVIRAHDLSVLFVTGPGHGGPALVASTYLEGTYTERYPEVTQDAEGMVLNSLGIVTVLKPSLGYKQCAEIAREGYETGKSLHDIVVKERGLLTQDKWDEVFLFENLINPKFEA